MIDFTNAQLNPYIDYSNSNDVIELLKYDSLIDAISINNINKINLNEIYEKITNKQHFLLKKAGFKNNKVWSDLRWAKICCIKENLTLFSFSL